MAGLITEILPGSIAAELGVAAGDELLSINGQPVDDIIDYNFLSADSELLLELRAAGGQPYIADIEKDEDEPLGLVFAADVFDGVRSCDNHCIFCFIDQLQPQPRPSLLLKDDDYRMSFLEGSFITCASLSEQDYRRIAALHLSPLYVSVHSSDDTLRRQLLGNAHAAPILPALRRLAKLGCTLHTQIVLCPGLNDNERLSATLNDLAALYPAVRTAAVVPVGLTRFNRNSRLRLYTPEEAAAVIDSVERFQQQMLDRRGSRFAWCADELYVKAGRAFPEAGSYEEFAQIENGVGMAARLLEQWQELRGELPVALPAPQHIGIVTGVNGAAVLTDIVAGLRRVQGLEIELITAANHFYGASVTATGLLCGSDIVAAVPPGRYQRLLIPANMCKFDADIFLDDMTVEQVETALQTPLSVVPVSAYALYDELFGGING
ncbi:MAG: DUF512 domain-containing protein [Bacillota bacterium]|nr:DUF512 domain-containing protein [Bacillota bacterium]